jgi:hypothetical protein
MDVHRVRLDLRGLLLVADLQFWRGFLLGWRGVGCRFLH